MASQGDADRIAGELLSLLKGSVAKPGTGVAGSGPQTPPEDNAMLGMIKNVLKQSLPSGARPGQQGSTPPAQPSAPVAAAGAMGTANAYVDWVGMYLRQEEERRAMHVRQSRERDETVQRQLREMESFAGISKVATAPTVQPPMVRPPGVQLPASRRFGIVPGRSVGNWAVETENGVKTFSGVSDEQAMREARRHGLTARSARLLDIHTYTPEELARMRSTFGVAGMRESMEAEFEQAIRMGLIPENSRFERLPNREWGYRVGDDPSVRKGADVVRQTGF